MDDRFTQLSLSHLLRACGLGHGEHDVHIEAGERPIDTCLRALRACGRNARLVRVPGAELASLPVPVFVALHGDRIAVITERTPRHYTLVDAGGTARRVAPGAMSTLLAGQAIELSEPLGGAGRFLRRLVPVLRAEHGAFGRALLLSGVLLVAGLAPPWLLRLVIDRALPLGDGSLLLAVVLATLAVKLHEQWLEWLRDRLRLAIDGRVEAAVQRGLFAHFMRAPLAEALRRQVGAQLETLQSALTVARTVTGTLLLVLLDAAMSVGYLVILLHMMPMLAVALCAIVALSTIATVGMGLRLAALEREHVVVAGAERARLLELVSGVRTIRALGVEDVALGRWLPKLIEDRRNMLAQGQSGVLLSTWLDSLHKLARVGVIGWGGWAVLGGQLSIGDFLASTMFAEGFMSATGKVLRAFAPILQLRANLAQVDELIAKSSASAPVVERPVHHPLRALEPEVTRPLPLEHALIAAHGGIRAALDIEMKDVWFRYSDTSPWTLRGYSLSIRRGEHFMLKGSSGGGKTTILRLIAGLLTPERGEVLIGGRRADAMRRRIAYLPQEPVLFAGSILSNLQVLSGASREHILAASQRTGLDTWLRELPMGLETVLPPGGLTLSGGQRQLVLLTAAAASRRPVLLLDESLAHLDRTTRQRLLHSELFANKTVIEVAHD